MSITLFGEKIAKYRFLLTHLVATSLIILSLFVSTAKADSFDGDPSESDYLARCFKYYVDELNNSIQRPPGPSIEEYHKRFAQYLKNKEELQRELVAINAATDAHTVACPPHISSKTVYRACTISAVPIQAAILAVNIRINESNAELAELHAYNLPAMGAYERHIESLDEKRREFVLHYKEMVSGCVAVSRWRTHPDCQRVLNVCKSLSSNISVDCNFPDAMDSNDTNIDSPAYNSIAIVRFLNDYVDSKFSLFASAYGAN
jgi:hypothetical protein